MRSFLGSAETAPLDEETLKTTISRQILKEEFDFADDVIEDILYVAAKTGVDPLVIGSIVGQESGGRRGVLNYCTKWGKPFLNTKRKKPRWEKKCDKWKSCYKNCLSKPGVWKNHLDVGLWGLRDVVERVGGPENSRRFAGWSWVRPYKYSLPKGTHVPQDCTLIRECSREVAAFAINSYQKEWDRLKDSKVGKANCRGVPTKLKWMGFWNGCSSAKNHAENAIKLQERRNLRVGIRYFIERLKVVTEDWPLGDFPFITHFRRAA